MKTDGNELSRQNPRRSGNPQETARNPVSIFQLRCSTFLQPKIDRTRQKVAYGSCNRNTTRNESQRSLHPATIPGRLCRWLRAREIAINREQ